MAYFNDADDVYKYIGGVFRKAGEHPESGPKLAASGVVMQVYYTDPDTSLTIRMTEPAVEVIEGGDDKDADVKLWMSADTADKYWRGEYNLAVGLAKGKVKAKGPVSKILKLVPVTKPLFPMYREIIAEKDGATA
ncbi:MAG: SCP2 sterol-binding domain-containing protein [Solirubrobacteraceae bacterium]|nr:SCP2 sterol-binding domain-containing protein [Solirubrobacteraceae bacterium]